MRGCHQETPVTKYKRNEPNHHSRTRTSEVITQRDEAREDKARLDWLEKRMATQDGETLTITEHFSDSDSSLGFVIENQIFDVIGHGATLRAAIDAAMNDSRD